GTGRGTAAAGFLLPEGLISSFAFHCRTVTSGAARSAPTFPSAPGVAALRPIACCHSGSILSILKTATGGTSHEPIHSRQGAAAAGKPRQSLFFLPPAAAG